LIAAVIAIVAAAHAGEGSAAVAEGLASGLMAAGAVYCVLRFDARTIPGFIVAGAIMRAAEDAALKQTAFGWTAVVIGAVITIAIGTVATRYIGGPSPPPASADNRSTGS
jgi:hypothetical protein